MSWLRLATLALVWTLVGWRQCAWAGSPDRAADEAAIRSVIAATTDRFNQHDAAGFASYYTPDADLMTVRGEVMKGTAEIRSGLQRIFDARAASAALREVNVTVRFVAPDVAIAHVTNELTGLVDGNGAPLAPHRERSIRVFVRTRDGWKVTAFQNTRLAEGHP